MSGGPRKRLSIAHPVKRARRYTPTDEERNLSRGIMEGLLAWWRTTERDGADQPIVCSHGEPTRGGCEECGRDRRGNYPNT